MNSNVIFLSETHLDRSMYFNLPHHIVFRKDHRSNSMGVALAVRKEFQPTAHTLATTADIQHVSCQFQSRWGVITAVSLYIHPQAAVSQSAFEHFLTSIPQPCIVCGDFNAKHQLWGDQTENQRGRALFQAVEETNLVVLNNGQPTRFDANRSWSSIDITLISSDLSLMFEWFVLDTLSGSDHFPIVFSTMEVAVTRSQRAVNFSKVDWDEFTTKMEEDVEAETNPLDFDQFFQLVWNALLHSSPAPKSCPVLSKIPQVYWNDELTAAKAQTRAAFKRWKRMLTADAYEEYAREERRFRSLVKRKKTESWQKYCDSLDDSASVNTLWKMARRYKGRIASESRNTIPEPILEELLDRLAPKSASKPSLQFAACNCNNHVRGKFFSMCDFKSVLKSGKDSAPGVDGVSYSVISRLSFLASRKLLEIYNEIYESGVIPEAWKIFQIVAIPKPGQQLTSASSIRPLALASCFRKIYEVLIKEKLEWHLESMSLLPVEMCGFRKGKGTMDAVSLIVDQASQALQQQEHVAICCIDIKGAYDNVEIDILVGELRAMNVSECIVKAIFILFQERVIISTLSDNKELRRTTWKGLPQGSPLSPICFNVFICRLIQNIPMNIIKVDYADDITLGVRGRDLYTSFNILQVAVDDLIHGIEKLGLDISPAKSCVMLIAKQQPVNVPEIRIRGEAVPCVPSVKLLGVQLTSNLSWSCHVAYLKKRVLPYMNFLRSISSQYWGAHPSAMLKIYKSCIRPILEYGGIFLTGINKRDVLTLERAQYASIRICLSSTKTTHTGSLEVMSGLPPLSLRRDSAVIRHVNKRLALETWQRRFLPLQHDRSPICQAMRKFEDFLPGNHTLPNIPCFMFDAEVRMKNLNINLNMIKRMENPRGLSVAEMVEDELATSHRGTQLFATDGSKDGGSAGYAVVNDFGIPHVSVKLPNAVSVFMAELLAIRKAVQLISRLPSGKYVILSDSLSSLKSLQSSKLKSSNPVAWFEIKLGVAQAQARGSEIAFIWVPAHRGVPLNEAADVAAKQAHENEAEDDYVMTSLDVSFPTKRIVLEQWQLGWTNGTMGRFCSSIIPSVSSHPWFECLSLSRRQIIIVSKLISNHSRLPAHLRRNNIISDDLCSCGVAPADPEHLLFSCARFEEERGLLLRTLVRKKTIPDLRSILCSKDEELLKLLADFFISCRIDL